MNELYSSYYRARLVCTIVSRYILFGVFVAVVLWVAGCYSPPRSQAYLDARTECERNAAPARALMLATIYNHCMQAKGFK